MRFDNEGPNDILKVSYGGAGLRADAIREIFTVNLGVKKEERVLVFTDLIQPSESVTDDERKRRSALVDIARDVAQAGSGLCEVEYLEYPAVGSHGKEPPKAMWEAVFGLQAVLELEKKGVLGRILDKKADTEHLKEAEHILERPARATPAPSSPSPPPPIRPRMPGPGPSSPGSWACVTRACRSSRGTCSAAL